MDDYFITGYTGFCPDIAEHIGHNYHTATREIMRVHPHVKTRLSSVSYPPKRQRYQGDSSYSASPEFAINFQSDPVSGNVWRPCHGDGQSYDGPDPEKAYSLACSEWGSPCVSKHCNEIYAPCLRTHSYHCQDHVMIPSDIDFTRQVHQRDSQMSAPCCYPCAKGESCSGDSKSETSDFKYPRKKSESCCDSCAKGGRCIDNSKSGTSMHKYPGKSIISLQNIKGYREGGVIPNYMGHIPGLQNSFGESYGIAACRLLRRHFDERSRKQL